MNQGRGPPGLRGDLRSEAEARSFLGRSVRTWTEGSLLIEGLSPGQIKGSDLGQDQTETQRSLDPRASRGLSREVEPPVWAGTWADEEEGRAG